MPTSFDKVLRLENFCQILTLGYCRNKSDDTMVIPQVEVTLSSSTPELGLIDNEDLITSGEQIHRSSSVEHKKSNFILSKKW